MRDFRAFLRWLIRWAPAFGIGAVGTWAVISFGWLASLLFVFNVLKGLLGVVGIACIITAAVFALVIAFEFARSWIYQD